MLEVLLSSHLAVVYTLLLGVVCLIWVFYGRKTSKQLSEKEQNFKSKSTESPVTNVKSTENGKLCGQKENSSCGRNKKIKILYGTQTGKSKYFADNLSKDANYKGYQCEVVDLQNYDPDESLSNESNNAVCLVIFISTYTEGTAPKGAEWFVQWLEESASDFRVQKSLLSNLHYAVFGLGNSLYEEHFNTVGKHVDHYLHKLSGHRILPVGLGDENVSQSHKGVENDYVAWKREFWKKLKNKASVSAPKGNEKTCENGGQCTCEEKDDVIDSNSSESESDNDESTEDVTGDDIVDVEDIGRVMGSKKQATKVESSNKEPSEMITPIIKKSLEKQGYKLIGSHSGVKLCRWTKSMLRGRGGCYKHTFYGIESHRCMETTPSLACANKCVFCWRHHTNPVGTEWRWKMDDAEFVFNGALQNHVSLIKQFKGVPGVQPERFLEGLTPKHCALSLVGEPIMYPKINKFIELLHDKEISTFMVTNAQFPDAIRDLSPVTQLYVSVDASTKDSLKKIDRPLFRDFWERFISSLDALSAKCQRTVYRLTLVKAWNTDELDNYASLVSRGKPDFIEVKGVTYCGESKASSLTMENVPWHTEVVNFVQELVDRLDGNYEIAAEHEHSNCVLVANKKFFIDGKWWTWIDYQKFHSLIKQYRESDGKKTFSSDDYMAQTPDWAVFGAEERGFDPKEVRHFRKKKDF
ncbi:S-adenosyl-L-methionine-dependent tRNA 4-demethylwyosine synthase TYW1-like [Crassostrea virginica]